MDGETDPPLQSGFQGTDPGGPLGAEENGFVAVSPVESMRDEEGGADAQFGDQVQLIFPDRLAMFDPVPRIPAGVSLLRLPKGRGSWRREARIYPQWSR